MTDDQIINSVTQAEPRDLDDFRRNIRIAVLQARLDEWSHVPAMTRARNRTRITILYGEIQQLKEADPTSHFPLPTSQGGADAHP